MGRSAPLRGPRPSCQRSPSIVEPPGPSLSLHQGQCRSGGRKSLRPADAQFRTKGWSPLSPRTGLGGWLRETWAAGADVNVRPTFTTGVLSHPQRKKETEAFIPESRKGSPAWSAAAGPLCLSQGRDCLPACLPGPPARPFSVLPPVPLRPPLEKNQGLEPWKLSVRPQRILEADSSYPARWTQPRRADKCLRFSLSLLRSVYGLARQAEGLGSGETSVWKLPGGQEPWRAASSSFYLDMPPKSLTCCLRTSKSPGWPGHCSQVLVVSLCGRKWRTQGVELP